jgi:hypothetical protein
MKYSNEELLKMAKEKFAEFNTTNLPMEAFDVVQINYKPHPYMIGSRHIEYASNHFGGMLGEETLRAVPCAMRNCHAMYEEHTSNTVLVIRLNEDVKNTDEFVELLKNVLSPLDMFGLEGCLFLENGHKII